MRMGNQPSAQIPMWSMNKVAMRDNTIMLSYFLGTNPYKAVNYMHLYICAIAYARCATKLIAQNLTINTNGKR